MGRSPMVHPWYPGVQPIRHPHGEFHSETRSFHHLSFDTVFITRLWGCLKTKEHVFHCDMYWEKSICFLAVLPLHCCVAHQAPLSMGFSRQEYWRGLPFRTPGDLPTELSSPSFSFLLYNTEYASTSLTGLMWGLNETEYNSVNTVSGVWFLVYLLLLINLYPLSLFI